MTRHRKISAFGWEIKRRLAELELDQREFCKKYGIPEARLSEIITGTRPAKRYRKMVEQILGVDSEFEKKNDIFKGAPTILTYT